MDIISIFVFLVLGLYIDQVVPNEFGAKRHPLFFLPCLFGGSDKIQSV